MIFTAKFTKLQTGFMGQILELPEVITEGADIEECNTLLVEALQDVILAYKELGSDFIESSVYYRSIVLSPQYVG